MFDGWNCIYAIVIYAEGKIHIQQILLVYCSSFLWHISGKEKSYSSNSKKALVFLGFDPKKYNFIIKEKKKKTKNNQTSVVPTSIFIEWKNNL